MSGWDAPQLAVIGAAGIGAAGATWAAYITSRHDARARRSEAFAATRAAEYRHVLRLVYNIQQWSLEIVPSVQFEGDRSEPIFPPQSEQAEAAIGVNLHGSQRVRDLYAAFRIEVRAFISDASGLVMLNNDAKGFSPDDYEREERTRLRRALPKRRDAILEALSALQDGMAADLDDERRLARDSPHRWWRRGSRTRAIVPERECAASDIPD